MSNMDTCQHLYTWYDTTQRTSHALLRCDHCEHQRAANVVNGEIVDPDLRRVGVVTYRLRQGADSAAEQP